MAKYDGTFNFAAAFQVKLQGLLDPRQGVETKSELITKSSFPYDGDNIYMKEGMLVSVAEEQSVYMLIDLSKILSEDYSGWKRLDAGAVPDYGERVSAAEEAINEIVERLDAIEAKLGSVYEYKGSVATYAQLPTEGVEKGHVYNVEEATKDYPANTNFAWNGEAWDSLGGMTVDMSSYQTEEDVKNLIGTETATLTSDVEKLKTDVLSNTGSIQTLSTDLANTKASTESLSAQMGTANDNISALQEVVGGTLGEGESTLLVRMSALEDAIFGGSGDGEGEEDQTLSEKVTALQVKVSTLESNVGTLTTNYNSLEPRVKANEDAITLLNGEAETEGSVKYMISKAFEWVEVNA